MGKGRKKIPRLNLKFKFSEKWLSNYSHTRTKIEQQRGTVLYECQQGTCYMVRIDGQNHNHSFHKSFITIIEDEN